MQFTVRVLFLCLVVAFVSAKKQCTKGACCDIKTGLFKKKGSKCSKSSNECHVANATCSGFSASCTRTNKKDGTKCSKGVCKKGTCVKQTKSTKKTTTKKPAKKTTTTKKSTKKTTTKKPAKTTTKKSSKDKKAESKKVESKKAESKKVESKKTETKKTEIKETVSSAPLIKVASNIQITPEIQREALRIVSELEKANTLLSSIQLSGPTQQQALNKVLSLIAECMKLQQTSDAAELSVASSKIQASIQVAINQLNVASTGADPSTVELMKKSLVELQKVSIRAKAQKKATSAIIATDANAAKNEARKQASNSQKVDALIKEGLPVITRQAIRAADKISALQQRRIARLMAEALIAEKREKARIIDQDLRRINKKAHAARKDALRIFARAEAQDEDAQEIKRAARQIVESDPEMKMRYFFGLTRELLASNREKFNRRYIKKVPLDETYSDHLDKEHTIIERSNNALVNSGFFDDKYGRANITLPEVSTQTAPTLLKALMGDNDQKINYLAVGLFAAAGVLCVIIIFAIIGKFTGKNKKNERNQVDDEDSYEKF